MRYKFRATGCELQVKRYKIRVAKCKQKYKLRVTGCELQVKRYKIRVVKCKLQLQGRSSGTATKKEADTKNPKKLRHMAFVSASPGRC